MLERVNVVLDTITPLAIPLGISLGTVISWSLYKSILWAIIHGLLGWVYVIYYYFILL